MKNTNPEKKSLRRQLLSGTVYVALAAIVVAVTVNTTVGMLSGESYEIPDANPDNINVEIPSLSEIPPLTIPKVSFEENTTVVPPADDSQIVSDIEEGVTSTVTEDFIPETIPETFPVLSFDIPEDADLGIDKFIKPCDGYVSKEHSAEIPVYSTTLSDYRIHIGVDVTGEIGTPVAAVIGGIVTDIYNDDLYGKTVCIKSRDGYTVKYSNLMPSLYAGVEAGSLIKTGQTIGGIGDTALCEAVDSPHVHIEIYNSDGTAMDPENLISF